ncbi:hypothetical protein FSARC_13840 [Fusarium sarcochroum]|uniref:Uncharacterized protein n=1 Tax=Fusarium sarcochroum TaxID=1208366 RepID=A0A8H4WRW8_9HYPO|nr:hypothetical protein FSARC_13840 [Fusarium sarcochroum]
MDSSASNWKCLYVRPEDLELCIRTHVVGHSSHPSLLEVAVHPQVPVVHPYQDLPNMTPISIDSLVAGRTTGKSWQNAQIQALYKFIKQAQIGIEAFGSQIGDYYRERYPKLQPWIEYLVLDYDLPKSDAPSRRRKNIVLDDFSRAFVLLALSVADPHDQAARRLKRMNQSQVLEILRGTLNTEFKMLHRHSQVNLNTIGLIRHVLVQAGGPQNLAQMNLLDGDCRDVYSSSAFATLMGISGQSKYSARVPVETLIVQLSQSQTFVGLKVDWHLVTNMTQKLKLPFWMFITSIPDEWTSGLSSQSWRSLRALLNDASCLHQSLNQPHNAERLFSVWAYLIRKTYVGAKDQIQEASDTICARAIWSLARSQTTPAQMALDLMTVACVSRLFPRETSPHQQSSSMEALDKMLMDNSRNGMLGSLNRLLASLHRVLSAENYALREPKLARFISQVKIPNLVLELDDTHADQYFADRMINSSGHVAAFAKLCNRTGWFPVKLAPLQLS